MSFPDRLRSYFLRGLAVLLPTILTIWIFVFAYRFVNENISIYINRALVRLIIILQPEPGISHQTLEDIMIKGLGSVAGFVIALVAVFIVGVALASVVGKTFWHAIERFILNTPVLKQVYPNVKQVTDFLFTHQQAEPMFSRVVAVQYPRKGVWSVGLVTGTGIKKVSQKVNKEMLSVLIPTSPTPFTGFIIIVPKEDTIDVDITIEQAIRFTVSGGVITPDRPTGPLTDTRDITKKEE